MHPNIMNLPIIVGILTYFLLGLAGLILIVLAAWTYFNWTRFRHARARAEQAYRTEHTRPDGHPYPPFGRGFCDNCAQAFDKVYFLQVGGRLCPACYEVFWRGQEPVVPSVPPPDSDVNRPDAQASHE